MAEAHLPLSRSKNWDRESERGSGQMPGEGGRKEPTPQTRLWAGFCAATHPSQNGCPGPSPSRFSQSPAIVRAPVTPLVNISGLKNGWTEILSEFR